jgi:uncharacterized protein (DUF362 family)
MRMNFQKDKTGFVMLRSLFKKSEERNLDHLASVYEDKSLLLNEIEAVAGLHLTRANIEGKRILLKPNWVRHSVKSHDQVCLRTHDKFVLGSLEFILKLNPAFVVIGDAPIQGCKWESMISECFIDDVAKAAQRFKIPVEIKDFRRVTFDPSNNSLAKGKRPLDEYIIFDVADQSFLEPITPTGKNVFRVTQYNPDSFTDTHKPGMHKYCITKELFKADIVISLPKIKTHQKAGITGALKNIVGLNGDKDFLPHHRLGGAEMGGDCYPGGNYLRYWSELCQDAANRNQGNFRYWLWVKMSSILWRLSFPTKEHHLGAGWYGNDTTWRMVMDLNLILLFGKADGTLAESPQRMLYSLCDAIIGGQDDGPLNPQPFPLGFIGFSNDSSGADLSFATLMDMEIERIPLLRSARQLMYSHKLEINMDGKKVNISDLKKKALRAKMPPGWINYNK